MANTIRLDIVTPERIVYAEAVNMVIVRATDGDLGVLPGHVPLIAGLEVWPVRVLTDEGEKAIAVSGGFIEVRPDKVTILAGSAEQAAEIDIDRARSARERAEERLRATAEEIDVARAEAALRRAIVRLKVADNSSHKH